VPEVILKIDQGHDILGRVDYIHIVIFDEGVVLEVGAAPLAHVTTTVRMEDEDSGGQAGIINMTMAFFGKILACKQPSAIQIYKLKKLEFKKYNKLP
jgi:hypothetical protein